MIAARLLVAAIAALGLYLAAAVAARADVSPRPPIQCTRADGCPAAPSHCYGILATVGNPGDGGIRCIPPKDGGGTGLCADGSYPDAGKDGEPGNDACDHSSDVPLTVTRSVGHTRASDPQRRPVVVKLSAAGGSKMDLLTDTREAYARGIGGQWPDGTAYPIGGRVAYVTEAEEAVASWTRAAFDHAETSYWGAAHVRAMRAYWLGRLRVARWNAIAAGTPRGFVRRDSANIAAIVRAQS